MKRIKFAVGMLLLPVLYLALMIAWQYTPLNILYRASKENEK